MQKQRACRGVRWQVRVCSRRYADVFRVIEAGTEVEREREREGGGGGPEVSGETGDKERRGVKERQKQKAALIDVPGNRR
jgi:hypothetical protein